jgi:hypothetical protein
MEWLLDLWFKITNDRPPLDPRVLLLDDQRIWSPGPSKNKQQLWQRLRLIVLFSIWVSRCSREIYASAADGDISAAAIKLVEEDIKTAVNRDFTRTRIKEAMVEAAVGSIDSSGRDLSLSIDDFKARWAVNDILCSVVLSANGSVWFCDPTHPSTGSIFLFSISLLYSTIVLFRTPYSVVSVGTSCGLENTLSLISSILFPFSAS